MHISEGVLSMPVLIGGAVIGLAGVAIGLKKIESDQLPKAGIMSAAFFVASFIHVPIGATNIHLTLNGLVGILLGYGAFPVITVGLLLQALLFQFGGLTALGVNSVVIALPPVFLFIILKRFLAPNKDRNLFIISFAFGFLSVLMSTLLMIIALLLTGEAFNTISSIIFALNIPILFIEGAITAFCVTFIAKVKPGLLNV